MSGDIEEFLRRAAARRAQQKAGKPQQAPPAATPQPQPAPRVNRPPAALEVEVVEDDISSLVEAHIDTQKFEQRAKTAGARIGQTDERVEARIHQKFDRDVGALRTPIERRPVEKAPEEQDSFVSEIAKMLANPSDIRRAIILSEIMNPPSHRWDD